MAASSARCAPRMSPGRRARHDHRRQAASTNADVTIDAHVHLWRLSRGDNVALGPAMAPIYRDCEPADLKPLIDAASVERVVVVQAAGTLAETLFTVGLARKFAGSPASSRGWSWPRPPSKRKSARSPGTHSSKACARCGTTTGASPGCSIAGSKTACGRCRTTPFRSTFSCKTGEKFRWPRYWRSAGRARDRTRSLRQAGHRQQCFRPLGASH